VDFDLPEELLLLKRTVREFVEGRLQPLEKQIEDDDKIPDAILKEMGALGFFGLPFPEEYGGAGAGDLGYCVALEEFGRTSAAFSNLIGAHTSIGSMSIYLGGTEAQKKRYLPDLTAGRKIAAFSITEPSSGSSVHSPPFSRSSPPSASAATSVRSSRATVRAAGSRSMRTVRR